MTPAEIRTKVIEIVAEELPGASQEDGFISKLDSVQRLTLVVALEDHFQICFDPDSEDGLLTLNDVVNHIHQQLSAP